MDFNPNAVKISAGLLVKMNKLIVKFIPKCKNLKEPTHFEKRGLTDSTFTCTIKLH